ncbi:hypothetical protein [Asticcacaulis sp.]|uniref:hypothetical protein n=1 Tax=Asticcacaulis sp. TaxID=1872648 RepID=UPI002C14A0CB|nr:hypothetical protein [Asticcacaulis sp.]HTM81505.1 hypothetical protein [Asticcacaulis sp.]
MTDYPTPKFPATPEEVKAASEKVVNFWVGALSPMWVPFWAASSFGLGAWAMTQSLTKNEGLLKDMPQMADMAGKWPGFTGVWGVAAARAEAAVKAAEDTVEKTAEALVETVEAAPEPKVVFDPVIEAPVAVSGAVVEAPAVLKAAAKPVKAALKIEPKPIARAVSAVKKPTKKA